ncbi:MAG TPA: UvrD-helicase domain-containing protein [Bacteroidia bacterium]|nr:UvrD-helicase domain-containing protein [Bacteroidia bacterium]
MNSLKIYKSSAGSGKTFTLVKEYLRLVLQNPDDFRHILAITFTNKAAGEMKERIVSSLVDLSKGKGGNMRELMEEELPGRDLSAQANKALKNILHDYTSFSVSTIDSFFQRLLRSLAREMHLPLRLEIEIDLEDAIDEVTDRLLRDIGNDEDLTEWMSDLLLQKMDEAKGWNIEQDIAQVAKELFRDRMEDTKILTRDEIRKIYKELMHTRTSFESRMKSYGIQSLQHVQNAGLDPADFSYGKAGVIGYFEKIKTSRNPDDYILKQRALQALESVEKWYTKNSTKKDEITAIVGQNLHGLLQAAANLVETEYKTYLSAFEALRRIYIFGISNDILKKFGAYRNEKNVILLADTPRLLSEVITGQDAPFIYEKVGNRFKHLLIDEFQDTSILQWKNLLPLVINSLGSGNMALVVGDAKQSIYRWRGGNMQLLVKDIFDDLRQFKSIFKEEVLSTNFRSKKNIVDFNNSFFLTAPRILGEALEMNSHPLLKMAYAEDLAQHVSYKNNSGGYVNILFIDTNEQESESDEDEPKKWKEIAREKTKEKIRGLLDSGYRFRDIAILVRNNKDGNEMANYLFDNNITEVISPDSLLIKMAPQIRFLINLLRFLADPADAVSRSEILFHYLSKHPGQTDVHLHSIFGDHAISGHRKKTILPELIDTFPLTDNLFNKTLPPEFIDHVLYLSKLPIYELTEHLIRIFGMNKTPDAYIQRFQDLVLEYNTKFISSLHGFLQWWNENQAVEKCSVIIPENENAIRIMTIHGSKGLQFPVVLMPFCDWKLTPKSNELLWAVSAEEPYHEMGHVAVLTSNRLKETFFKDSYEEELSQSVIDNLNLLYVAFTRAEEQLLVYTPVTAGAEMNSISRLLKETLPALDLEFVGENSYQTKNAEEFLKQERKKVSTQGNVISEKLKSYPSNRWQEKISVSSRAKDLSELTEDKQLKKMNYGILVHKILSIIRHPEEVSKAVQSVIYEGLISGKEKVILTREIEDVLAVEQIAAFFDSGWESRTEREIILPDGRILRPDRVIYKENQTRIIDFKTGKKQKSHEEQIIQYAGILEKMGYQGIKKYLVYIADKSVVEVP